MRRLLSEICQVTTGVYEKVGENANTLYLQSKDFDEGGQLIGLPKPEVENRGRLDKHLLKDKDILFVSKGSSNIAAMYSVNWGVAVASSSFLVVRIADEARSIVLPEYVAWYLKQYPAQRQLNRLGVASTLKLVNLSVFIKVEIYLPPIRVQEQILQILQLQLQEQRLTSEIAALNSQIVSQKLLHIVSQRSHHAR